MTQTQLNALNLFCAEKVMGWTKLHKDMRWSPATDPAQAMRVLEKCLAEQSIAVSICKVPKKGWSVFHGAYRVEAETLPLAIVKFAEKIFSK